MAQRTGAAVWNTQMSDLDSEGGGKECWSLVQQKDGLLYLERSIKGLRALNVIGVFEFSVRLQAL